MATKTRSIQLSQLIAAPASKIYPKLIDGNELSRWFPTRAETDPVVGGHYMLSFEFAPTVANPRPTHSRTGEYLELKTNERVRYTWDVDNTEVTFDLKETDGGTEVSITHSGWPEGSDEAYKNHLSGWGFFLANLKSLVEDGLDSRTTAVGMKVEA
jgi:uncharacterized protein YndB with AHSA1/START domain